MTATARTTARGQRPTLITDAGMSRQEEYAVRRRRYGALMIGRVVCIVAAFVVGSVYSNIWLAGAFIAGAAVLPWAAVLIANDRLPTATRHPSPSAPVALAVALPAAYDPASDSSHRVIES